MARGPPRNIRNLVASRTKLGCRHDPRAASFDPKISLGRLTCRRQLTKVKK